MPSVNPARPPPTIVMGFGRHFPSLDIFCAMNKWLKRPARCWQLPAVVRRPQRGKFLVQKSCAHVVGVMPGDRLQPIAQSNRQKKSGNGARRGSIAINSRARPAMARKNSVSRSSSKWCRNRLAKHDAFAPGPRFAPSQKRRRQSAPPASRVMQTQPAFPGPLFWRSSNVTFTWPARRFFAPPPTENFRRLRQVR